MEFLSSSSQHHSFRSGFAAFPSISVFIRSRPYGPTRVLASRDHETSCQVRGNPDATRQQCGSNAPANETGFYKLRGCRATMIPPHTSRNLLQWTLAIGHAIAEFFEFQAILGCVQCEYSPLLNHHTNQPTSKLS
jgi:hypothetical protein